MFKTRLISGIVLVLIALLTICTGNIVLFMTLLAVSLIGTQELYKAMKVREEHFTLLEIAGYIGIIGYYLCLLLAPEYQLMELIGALVLLMFVYVFTFPKYHAEQIMAAMFGIIYVGVMLSFIYQTRCLDGGAYHVWLIFISSWGCDTCAYWVGILGAALLGAIYGAVTGGTVWAYALICAVGGMISMIGDLSASAIKRNQGIKDYGDLIPGHGGILDRFDSVIFTAPNIYFLCVTLI